jgi:hypothetical protein
MANSRQTIFVNGDLNLDIQYNKDLIYKPFLLRITGWDGRTEHRMSFEDMLNFAESIADFTFDNTKDVVYTDDLTGLAKLCNYRNGIKDDQTLPNN